MSDLENRKNDIIEELKDVEYSDLEDKVFRLGITNTETSNVLDMKYSIASTTRFTIPTGIYKISSIKSMLKNLLSNEVKVNNTFDDIRLKTNLDTNKAKRFTKRSFFYTILGFT